MEDTPIVQQPQASKQAVPCMVEPLACVVECTASSLLHEVLDWDTEHQLFLSLHGDERSNNYPSGLTSCGVLKGRTKLRSNDRKSLHLGSSYNLEIDFQQSHTEDLTVFRRHSGALWTQP